jgi:hypothetical protein
MLHASKHALLASIPAVPMALSMATAVVAWHGDRRHC